MRLLISGATVPDTLTPEDIDDDHVPYGFLYGTRAGGATMMGIAVAQHGEETDTAELDVPVIEALAEFVVAEDGVLMPLATSSAPVQYAQARAAWEALGGIYTLPEAGLHVADETSVMPMDEASVGDGSAEGDDADVEFH